MHSIRRGDVTAGFAASDEVVEGEVHTEAQEHFYLETNAAIVRPGDQGEMEIFASTQGPATVQVGVAKGEDSPEICNCTGKCNQRGG